MSEWQKIETAPRDGTKILCICMKTEKGSEANVGRMAVDWWHTRGKDSSTYEGFGKFNDQFWPPTHWMPLPEPPNDPR